MIYEAVRLKGKCSKLSPHEQHIIRLTIEAIDACVLDEVVSVNTNTEWGREVNDHTKCRHYDVDDNSDVCFACNDFSNFEPIKTNIGLCYGN